MYLIRFNGKPHISCRRSFCNNGSFICFTLEVHFLSFVSCLLSSYFATILSILLLKAETSMKQIVQVTSSALCSIYEFAKHVSIMLKWEIKCKSNTLWLLTIVALSYLQSTGTFFTTATYGSATHVPPSLISRGAGWLVGEVHGTCCLHVILFSF